MDNPIKIAKVRGWLGENITSLLAIVTTFFVMTIDLVILFKATKTNDTTTATILSAVHGAWMVVLGFYFVSSKGSKDKDKALAELTEKK